MELGHTHGGLPASAAEDIVDDLEERRELVVARLGHSLVVLGAKTRRLDAEVVANGVGMRH